MFDRIKIVILTIREFPDRLPYLLPLVEHLSTLGLPYEVFYGVYGKNITITDTDNPTRKLLTLGTETKLHDTSVRVNGGRMTAGEFGCSWSNLKIYEKLLADPDYDGYIVLEDDAAPAVPVTDIVQYLSNIPHDYDICRISRSIRDPYSKIAKVNNYYWTYARRFTNCAAAYIISKSGARKVIAHMEGRIDLPADDILTKTHICVDNFIAYTPDSYLFFDPGIHVSAIDRAGARAAPIEIPSYKMSMKMDKLKVMILTVRDHGNRMPNILSLVDQHTQIGLSCELIYGVNGINIKVSDTYVPAVKNLTYEGSTIKYDYRIRRNGQIMSPGQLGCAWSHIRLMEALLVDPNYDMYLILADDAKQVCDISNIAAHFQNLPSYFDVCRLSKSIWYPFEKLEKMNDYFYSHTRRYTNRSAAYIVSKSGAHKILNHVNGTLGAPSDDLLSNMYLQNPDFVSCIPETYLYHD